MLTKNVQWRTALIAVLSVVCLVLPTLLQAQRKSNNEGKVGIALYSFHRHSMPEALRLAKEAGVKNVEGFSFYNLGPEFGNKSWDNLSPEEVSKVKKMLKE